ncbi:MAG TPA: long-chain fatty acid--CoA ligase, partial [Mucilaginibacter sp.]|nr:long-chain fatty acid--CoA ligase [Mucilaginibacter sp.]
MNTTTERSTVPGLIRNIVKNIHPDTHTFMTHKVNDVWEEISYRQALDKIDAISAWLLDMGIQKGDRLALIIENCPDYVYYDQ